jgi:hypothetical protein
MDVYVIADLSVTVNGSPIGTFKIEGVKDITPGLPPWMASVELAVAEWRSIRGWTTESTSYEEANR